MEERIITAAYACFDRHGFSKTSIEDIAREAQVSRPTVYKYFSGKNDLADRISLIESIKVNSEVRRRAVRRDNFADSLTEALVIVIRVATGNKYIRRITESTQYTAHAAAPDSPQHAIYRELWGGMLRRAMTEGELAGDLELDQVISWLSFVEGPLMARVEAMEVSDEELRAFVRRFVVEPLLSARRSKARKAAPQP